MGFSLKSSFGFESSNQEHQRKLAAAEVNLNVTGPRTKKHFSANHLGISSRLPSENNINGLCMACHSVSVVGFDSN